MTRELVAQLIFLAGLAQLSVLIASVMVPFRLKWRTELQSLSPLNRQMHWVYAGYVVLSIVAFGLLSIIHADELAGGGALARGVCCYIAVFWGLRLVIQAFFEAKEHLTTWWLRAGYLLLTMMFAVFTFIYGWAALM